jgi:hypothetical protein
MANEGRRKKEEGRSKKEGVSIMSYIISWFGNYCILLYDHYKVMGASRFCRAKHSGGKSIALTNNLSAGMLRPYGYICKIGMLPR